MNILGLTGGMSIVNEIKFQETVELFHDAAAVLLQNGKVIAAIEEERLNRIKHTNKAPLNAILYCLKIAGIHIDDVDYFTFAFEEKTLDNLLKGAALNNKDYNGYVNFRDLFTDTIKKELGFEIKKDKIEFINHHQAHAASAYYASGVDDSLILVIDGGGDLYSGLLQSRFNNNFEDLVRYKPQDSLGLFYLRVIRHLGYYLFDEYKVMGLAPYGDPKVYRSLFKKMYTLEEGGNYRLYIERVDYLLDGQAPARAKGAPFTQQHRDIAAALQEALENIVLHILTFYKAKTNHTNLCLAGGVAQNCSLTGRILRETSFKNVFVQPLSYDAGCAYGSACTVANREGYNDFQEIKSVLWGKAIGQDDEISKELHHWSDIITFTRHEKIEEKTAELIANGKIIAWVQGRSEFGPRALGNRSILADPRQAEMKNIVNRRIKGREGYRPFAPSVLEEEVDNYFYTNGGSYPFMNFVHYVKEEYRDKLGAITHVDGTARVHTVSKDENPMYWQLIKSFFKITGIPVVLNTSYNNNYEPIVENIFDAITTFLTTELDYLVIGSYIISRPPNYMFWGKLIPFLYSHICLRKDYRCVNGHEIIQYVLDGEVASLGCCQISEQAYDILLNCISHSKTLGSIIDITKLENKKIIEEFYELWKKRFILFKPQSHNV
jgi:carbamoyltransferase